MRMKKGKGRWRITPLFGMMLAGLLLFDRSGFCLVTVLAAFLHECGHLLAAKLLRIPWKGLHMDFMGARLEVSGKILSYGEEWLLASAGPFASFVFAAMGAPLWHFSEHAVLFSCASLLLGVLNLLPIRTFDGGRMLECLLSRFCEERTVHGIMKLSSFLFLFLIWSGAIYFLLRAGDGLSLLFFSMSLFVHFFEACEEE